MHLVTATSLRIVTFVKKLAGNHLNITCSRPLPNYCNGTPAPIVNVGDKTFALSQHALRPNISRTLDVATHIYNYGLTVCLMTILVHVRHLLL